MKPKEIELRGKQVEMLAARVEVLGFRIELDDVGAVEAGLEASSIADELNEVAEQIRMLEGTP